MSELPVTPTVQESLPLSKGVIWTLCLLCTPLAGAILYYVWKKEHPYAANLANKISWLSWLLWIVVGVGLRAALKI
jgi:hypothetical protein